MWLRTQSVAKKTFFNQPAQRAGAFRNFSKFSRSVQERFETFQNLPAACRNTSKLFKVFPQRAGALRNFSKSSRSVQEHFETFQSLPAACRNTSKLFEAFPQRAGTLLHFSDTCRYKREARNDSIFIDQKRIKIFIHG
ncbi:MAG: hypothetical protein LBT76_02810 [Tannerella sp.]|jgi:hypothetical protein|nr:hypothetical protein [Tannerella sp.]